MCLINFKMNQHPMYKLIVAANRDEFYERPTAIAHFWEEQPNLLAGRDLRGMGTWLGITKEGRFAALTNIRGFEEDKIKMKSRGELVRHYLEGNQSAEAYLEQLKKEKDNYSGFNLLVGHVDQLWYFNNQQGNIENVESGIHGLSNHFLDTPWPKVIKGKTELVNYAKEHTTLDVDQLFNLLSDSEKATENLPDTGVDPELERQLSPLFIETPNYGTRCSTVLLVDHDNNVTFVERTYEKGKRSGDETFTFKLK